MNVFIDANVLVAVIRQEYPTYLYAARILSLKSNRRFKFFVTPIALSIIFYFIQKRYSTSVAKDRIKSLTENLNIAENLRQHVVKTFQNGKILDFEDGLEYYAAVENKCSCIITEDIGDFHFSEIDIVRPQDFFKQYFS